MVFLFFFFPNKIYSFFEKKRGKNILTFFSSIIFFLNFKYPILHVKKLGGKTTYIGINWRIKPNKWFNV